MKYELDSIRQAFVAGQFYPGTAQQLRTAVKAALSHANTTTDRRVRAIIVPHAGYAYSAQTAGRAFGFLGSFQNQYDRVAILAPSHRVYLDLIAFGPFAAYQTPMGQVKVDSETCQLIIDSSPLCVWQAEAHLQEHALEVQLPFIQQVMPQARLVPAICGQIPEGRTRQLSQTLVRQLWEPRTLWVVSSDFTHFGAAFGYQPFDQDIARQLRQLDMGAFELIKQLNSQGFRNYLARTGATICGSAPLAILIQALRESQTRLEPHLLDYRQSSQESGDYTHCVSYLSMAFVEA